MAQIPLGTPTPVSYQHIVNGGTTNVKTAAGALLTLNLNSGAATSTLGLYDQIGTTVAGTIGIFTLGTSDVLPIALPMGPAGGLKFNDGLVVIATGTLDATIGFR